MSPLILSYQDVVSGLKPGACAQAMAAVLAAHARGEAYMPLRSIMAPPEAPGFMGLMPAYHAAGAGSPGRSVFSLKAICLFAGNPAQGLDAHQGTVTLFDGDDGRPMAILNASAVTEIRTAAVTAVATRVLAREDATSLAIIGAGVQARSHLEALCGVRKFTDVRLYSTTAAHARQVAAGAPAGLPEVRVAASAREAIEGADVVVTATSSRAPVLEHEWLAPGAHVNAVGASAPSARELDVATVACAALFCDSRVSMRHEAGDYRLAVEQGAISGEEHIRAELGEVLAGLREGRRDDTELTVFRSLGLGVEDLAAAQLAVAEARRLGRGTEVEL